MTITQLSVHMDYNCSTNQPDLTPAYLNENCNCQTWQSSTLIVHNLMGVWSSCEQANARFSQKQYEREWWKWEKRADKCLFARHGVNPVETTRRLFKWKQLGGQFQKCTNKIHEGSKLRRRKQHSLLLQGKYGLNWKWFDCEHCCVSSVVRPIYVQKCSSVEVTCFIIKVPLPLALLCGSLRKKKKNGKDHWYMLMSKCTVICATSEH